MSPSIQEHVQVELIVQSYDIDFIKEYIFIRHLDIWVIQQHHGQQTQQFMKTSQRIFA